jgi:small subunit ribosomal protein S9
MSETAEKVLEALGTGRRKTSVARVRIRAGQGVITVNKRPMEEYFPLPKHRSDVTVALDKTGKRNEVNITIRVTGGGPTGQAGACKLGIARALLKFDPELNAPLREHSLLTRDGRMKERKKYGLRGARRGTQFSKR